MALIATASAVGVAWAKTLGLPVGTAVATTVPDASSWPVAGGSTSRAFLQVVGTGGGNVRDTPMRSSVLSFDAWATKTGSDRPPIELAENILADLMQACFDDQSRAVSVTANGVTVLVHSAWPITEHARRIPDQDTSRAHYSVDVQIMWTAEGS